MKRLKHYVHLDNVTWFHGTKAQTQPKSWRDGDMGNSRVKERPSQECLECQDREFEFHLKGLEEPMRRKNDPHGTEPNGSWLPM